MGNYSARCATTHSVDQFIAISRVKLNLLNAARPAALESYGDFGLPTGRLRSAGLKAIDVTELY